MLDCATIKKNMPLKVLVHFRILKITANNVAFLTINECFAFERYYRVVQKIVPTGLDCHQPPFG
jgi:hypothetical protein